MKANYFKTDVVVGPEHSKPKSCPPYAHELGRGHFHSFQCLFTFVCLLSVVVVDVVSQCDQELFQKLISYYIMHHSDQLPKSGQKKSKYLPMKRPKQVFVKSRSKVAKLGSLISSNLVTLLSA